MDRELESRTSVTLLGKLRHDPSDSSAWSEFVDRYGRKIYAWCRTWRLQEADAQDVTQIVLLKLSTRMRGFTYDPSRSFRGWLRTVTQHAWRDYVGAQKGPGLGSGGSQVLEMLHTVEARDDLVARLEEEFDRDLLREAMARVQLRIAPRTWQVFQLLAMEGRSGASVASQLGMKVAAVFVAKNRVKVMIQREIARLQGTERE